VRLGKEEKFEVKEFAELFLTTDTIMCPLTFDTSIYEHVHYNLNLALISVIVMYPRLSVIGCNG